MKAFRFSARSSTGERVDGVVQGESASAVSRSLVGQGVFPIDVVDLTQSRGRLERFTAWFRGPVGRSLRSQDLALFTRRLADLLDAGVPMQRSMEQLHAQTRDRRLHAVVGSISHHVRGGDSLSHALACQGKVFPRSLVGAVEAGETSGGLVQILQGLADLYEKEDELHRSVRGALLYPIMVLVVSIVTLLIMFLHLLPQLSSLYDDMGQRLPGPTRLLLGVSAWFESNGLVAVAVLGLVLAAIVTLRSRSPRVGRWVARTALAVPVVGRTLRHREIVRFAYTLASLVGGGVPLMRALWFSSRSSANPIIAEEIRDLGRAVGEGSSLSAAIAGGRLGDPVLVMMLEVGEQMGRLPDALEKASRVYERELRDTMGTITTLLEPLLIVAIGLIVGFIVFSMMLPIMELDLS